jgi:hypothetical protein
MSAKDTKFGRRFRLTVDTNDGQSSIVIQNPLTIKFTLSRSTLASLNTAELDIYNLGDQTRKRIYRDRFNSFLVQNGVRPQKITLEAGYSQLYQVFKGTVFEANSARQGVDIVTHISSKDGYQDITNTASFKTLAAGTSYDAMLKNLQGDFKSDITPGNTSPLYQQMTFKRPVSLNGNTWDLIRSYTNGQAFVDLEKIHTIQNKEVIVSGLPIIDASTGLINTPRRSDSTLIVTTLFEPRVLMGAEVQLISVIQKEYNGPYKVIGVQHQGTISDGVCENLYSTFTLLSPKVFGQFTQVNTPSGAPKLGTGGTAGAKPYDPKANTTQTNLARTLYGEGASLGPNGMTGIANVIMNRTAAGDYGGTVDGNIYAPGQFSMWNPLTGYAPNSPQNAGILNDYNNAVSVDTSNATYAQAYNIAGQALAGTLPDVTGGATNYYATSIPAPGWTSGLTYTGSIGNTRFYKP